MKARDYAADPHLLVLLNVQSTVDQWGDLMDYEQQEIGYAFHESVNEWEQDAE